MSKTLKQKVRHIFYDKDGNLNLRVPFKLRWSYINKIRRHNFDRDLDRAELAGKPAVAFWPLIDPDIPEHPYCRRCLDKAKIEVLIKSFAFSEKQAKAFVKMNNIMNDKNE